MSPDPFPRAILEAGTRLGRYEIVEAIGFGGMGEVYRATDTLLPRAVAVKTVRTDTEKPDERRKLLEREARIVAQVSHPHICPLYDLGFEGDIVYLVMEYLEGETLRSRLRTGALPPIEAIRLGIQVASALAEAHRHGVVHRDLKPGNIMLTGRGAQKDARLLDFGIAKWRDEGARRLNDSDDTLTFEGKLVGTTAYMSPEQIKGGAIDSRSDLFSLGAVLYEMLAGVPAFQADSTHERMAKILERDPPLLADRLSDAPPHLVHLVDRCLAKNPDDRWQTASDVMRELDWNRDLVANDDAEPAQAPGDVEDPPMPDPEWPPGITAAPMLFSFSASVAALYLMNPSLRDALLYQLLALIGAVPAMFLVAALLGRKVSAAAGMIIRVLGSVGPFKPSTDRQRFVLAASVWIFFGAVLSSLLGHGANGVMPHLRSVIPHFENSASEWVLENPHEDWRTYRASYKNAYLQANSGSEADWQSHKYAFGRGSIRAARTIFAFTVLMGMAGIVDIGRRRFSRGASILAVAVLLGWTAYAAWHTREGHYAKEMVSASLRLPAASIPELPASAPESLQRLLENREP